MNPNFRPGITSLSKSRVVTSRYTFPALETAPFILGAIVITMWEALDPGPDQITHVVDYMWYIPSAVMIQLATGYLVLHGFQNLRWEWYPIEPMTRAVLDVTRTYASCYILGLFGGALGFKMIFFMASYMQPYDAASTLPTANWTFRAACVFLVMAYFLTLLGIAIVVSNPLMKDLKRLRVLEELD